jgi:hypothetical protein
VTNIDLSSLIFFILFWDTCTLIILPIYYMFFFKKYVPILYYVEMNVHCFLIIKLNIHNYVNYHLLMFQIITKITFYSEFKHLEKAKFK